MRRSTPRSYLLQLGFWIHALIFSALLGVALLGGMPGLVLGGMALLWLLKYAVLLFDAKARRDPQAPVLGTGDIMPLSESRAFYLLIFATLLVGVVVWAASRSPLAGQVTAGVVLFLLPALLTAMLHDSDGSGGLAPLAVLNYLRLLGVGGVLLGLLLAGGGWLVYLLVPVVGEWPAAAGLVWVPGVVLALLALFMGCGILLAQGYARYGVDIAADVQGEKAEELLQVEDRHLLDRLYRMAAVGHLEQALQELERDAPVNQERRIDILEQLLRWKDPRLGLSWGALEVARLAERGERDRALQLLLWARTVEPRVVPASDLGTWMVAETARVAGKPHLALTLMEGFEGRFPDSPRLDHAWLLHAQLLCLDFQHCDHARPLIERLLTTHPEAARWPQVIELIPRITTDS